MDGAMEFSVFVAVVMCLGFVLGRLSARVSHAVPVGTVAAGPPPSTGHDVPKAGPPPSTSPTMPGVITLYSMIAK